MSKNHSLTYKEIVILHLRDFLDINEEITSPPDITQKGIANKVGMSRTHVSRVMKELTEEGLVFEKLSNIENKNRKMKIYRLTNKGVREYEEIISELNNSKVSVIIEKKEIEVPIPEIPEIIDGNIDVVDVLSMLRDTDDRLDLNEIKPKEKVKDIEECPEIDKLYQIEGVLEELKTWVQRDVPIVVVKGRKGCGASSVVSKFIKEIEDFHFCWVNVNGTSFKDVRNKILRFLKKIDKKIINEEKNEFDIKKMLGKRLLFIFDDYYDVDDKIVDFLSDIVERIEIRDEMKLLITARIGTPVYERFYQQEHVENNLVKEINIEPLNEEGIQKKLEIRLQDDALKRIKQLTKGSPLLLDLLKNEEKEKIKSVSPLSNEQISLLFFLKNKRIEKE